jgi:hypothetical protein
LFPVSASESKARPRPVGYDCAHRADSGVDCVCLCLVENNIEDIEQLVRRALFENRVKRPVEGCNLDRESTPPFFPLDLLPKYSDIMIKHHKPEQCNKEGGCLMMQSPRLELN